MDGQPGSLSSGFASSCQLVYSRWMSLEMDVAAIKKLDVRHLYYSCTSVTLHIVEFFFPAPLCPHPHTCSLRWRSWEQPLPNLKERWGVEPHPALDPSVGATLMQALLSLSLSQSIPSRTHVHLPALVPVCWGTLIYFDSLSQFSTLYQCLLGSTSK